MKILVTTDTHYCASTHEENVSKLIGLENKEFDIMIHCGDVGSSKYIEQIQYWQLVREILGNTFPIIQVYGNHDFWDSGYNAQNTIKRPKNVLELLEILDNELKPYNVTHASIGYEDENIIIRGFDGWYFNRNCPLRYTKDSNLIPHYRIDGEQTLYTREKEHSQKVFNELNNSNKKKILVTHIGFTPECVDDWKSKDTGYYFGNNPKYVDFIEKIDYVFYGHSHQEVDYQLGFSKIINVGSDYYNPKYRIIEV